MTPTPSPARPAPIIIDKYSQTATPWVRLELPTGQRVSVDPDTALEILRAHQLAASVTLNPEGAAARMERRPASRRR